MGRELGRISGPLLASNLRRNGTDLQFENSLLYLDVNSPRLGINTFGPSTDLTIGIVKNNGSPTTSTIQTTNLIVPNTSNIGNFVVSTDTIQHLTNSITIQPNQSSNPTIVTPGLSSTKLYFSGNTLASTFTNSDINFSPIGTGQSILGNDDGSVQVTVNADLHATGNITWDGSVTLGNDTSDNITFSADVGSNILPNQTTQWSLGSELLQWNNVYTTTVNATSNSVTSSILATSIDLGNFHISGNTIVNAANDATITGTGSGLVKFNDFAYITDNNINTPAAYDHLNLSSTLNGYVKFAGTTALSLPVGLTSEQPINPDTGTTRYNTDEGYLEIYNGTTWLPAYGIASNATPQDAEDFSVLYTIVFGY